MTSYEKLFQEYIDRWEDNEGNGNASDLFEVFVDAFSEAYDLGWNNALEDKK